VELTIKFLRHFSELIEKQGLKPIKQVIESMGGWPILEGKNWQDNCWFWQKILLQLELMGFGSDQIFSMSIDVDMKNSTRRMIYVNNRE
jgi:neprilysin